MKDGRFPPSFTRTSRSPRPRACLDERIEEHAVWITRDELELAGHAVDDLLRDLVGRLQRRRAREQQLAPVREEFRALARCAVVEVERLYLCGHVAIADGLQQIAELCADERIAAELELVIVECH